MTSPIFTPTRRRFLQSSALLGLGATTLGARPAQAADKVSGIMSPNYARDDLKAIILKNADVALENLPYVGPTDTLAKLLAPGGSARYDLMILNTDFAADRIMGEKAGQEKGAAIDLGIVKNIEHLMPTFRKAVQERDGKVYMIPVSWGYDAVLFDRSKVPEQDPLTQSWGILFNDKYAGRVALRDEPLQSIMVAGLHLGHGDVFNMDKPDIRDCTRFLISKKKNIRALWSKYGEGVNMLGSGEVVAMYGWISMRSELQKNGKDIANNWPSEGAMVWHQSAFIPRDSRNAKAAARVINAMLDPEYGIARTRLTEYPSPSKAVKDSLGIEEQRRLGYDLEERGVKTLRVTFPKLMDDWVTAWNDFKAA